MKSTYPYDCWGLHETCEKLLIFYFIVLWSKKNLHKSLECEKIKCTYSRTITTSIGTISIGTRSSDSTSVSFRSGQPARWCPECWQSHSSELLEPCGVAPSCWNIWLPPSTPYNWASRCQNVVCGCWWWGWKLEASPSTCIYLHIEAVRERTLQTQWFMKMSNFMRIS